MKKLSLETGFKEKVWTITDAIKHIEDNLDDYYAILVEKDLDYTKGYIYLEQGKIVCSDRIPRVLYYNTTSEKISETLDVLNGNICFLNDSECIWELVK